LAASSSPSAAISTPAWISSSLYLPIDSMISLKSTSWNAA
jgi:hypothetical protein